MRAPVDEWVVREMEKITNHSLPENRVEVNTGGVITLLGAIFSMQSVQTKLLGFMLDKMYEGQDIKLVAKKIEEASSTMERYLDIG